MWTKSILSVTEHFFKTHIFILHIGRLLGRIPLFLWGYTADFKGTLHSESIMTAFHLPVLWKINHINYQVYIHIILSIYHSLISPKFYAPPLALVRIFQCMSLYVNLISTDKESCISNKVFPWRATTRPPHILLIIHS
jgi:hypothetical protein